MNILYIHTYINQIEQGVKFRFRIIIKQQVESYKNTSYLKNYRKNTFFQRTQFILQNCFLKDNFKISIQSIKIIFSTLV